PATWRDRRGAKARTAARPPKRGWRNAKPTRVGEFAEVFMAQYSKPRKKSWRNERAILDADILPTWKHRAMRDLTRRDARDLLQTIVDRGAPIHANRVHACLSKFLAYAVTQDVVEHNFMRDLPKPSKERVRERVPSPE